MRTRFPGVLIALVALLETAGVGAARPVARSGGPPTVTTNPASAVSGIVATPGSGVATLNGLLNDNGGEDTTVGFVYSKTSENSDPSLGGTGVTDVPLAGIVTSSTTFTFTVIGLDPTADYSFKSYAANASAALPTPVYGAVQTFGNVPTVTTLGGTNLEAGRFTVKGTVSTVGEAGRAIMAAGALISVQSVNPIPTIGGAGVTQCPDSPANNPPGTGDIAASCVSVMPNTVYSLRTVATNNDAPPSTGYGAVMTIQTPKLNSPSQLTNIANQPAATLLLPYFEVDMNDLQGNNTVFTVLNTVSTAVLTNVTIWSDLGVPVTRFNVYLTGYDVQPIDLGQIIRTGVLPQTASVSQDPANSISPQGPISGDVDIASCGADLPPAALTGNNLLHLQNSLMGQASPISNLCAARAYSGPTMARGYVTIDTVQTCAAEFPSDAGYFLSGGGGIATNHNQLTGDYLHVNEQQNLAMAEPLVHIRANATDHGFPGTYTFYGRYVGWTAADNREPLSTGFLSRYVNRLLKEQKKARRASNLIQSRTDLIVWRDPKVNQTAFPCPAAPGVQPLWYPLGQEGLVIFDEQENPLVPISVPIAPVIPPNVLLPFQGATQRVRVSGSLFPVAFDSGFLHLNLNTTVIPAGDVPPTDPAAAQAWITTFMSVFKSGHYDVGYRAVRLDTAFGALHRHPPQ